MLMMHWHIIILIISYYKIQIITNVLHSSKPNFKRILFTIYNSFLWSVSHTYIVHLNPLLVSNLLYEIYFMFKKMYVIKKMLILRQIHITLGVSFKSFENLFWGQNIRRYIPSLPWSYVCTCMSAYLCVCAFVRLCECMLHTDTLIHLTIL